MDQASPTCKLTTNSSSSDDSNTHWLWDTATNCEYYLYLQNKFNWSYQIMTTVHWQIHTLAQCRLKHAEKWIISRFIHEWLPLQDRYHIWSTSVSIQCPSCRQSTEMVEHFMQCPHLDQQAMWHNMHESIYKAQNKHNAFTQCYNALAYGLYQRVPNTQKPSW